MTNLTYEEEQILRPEYEKYCAFHAKMQNRFPHLEPLMLRFDDWWRAKANNAKEEAKYASD